MISLQDSLNRLTALARDHEVDLLTTIDLQVGGGAVALIHWTPTCGEALPRECHLYFSDDNRLLWAWVIEPRIWLNAVDEGLTTEIADDTARRMVESQDDIERYLKGVAYKWRQPKQARAS